MSDAVIIPLFSAVPETTAVTPDSGPVVAEFSSLGAPIFEGSCDWVDEE